MTGTRVVSRGRSGPGLAVWPVSRERRGILQRRLETCVVLLLGLGLYYNWYRYPFRINSTDTSPTYSDTPYWLSLGKYLILLTLLTYAAVGRASVRDRVRIGNPVFFVGFVYLAFFPIVSGLLLTEPDLIVIGLPFLVPPVLLSYSGSTLPAAAVNRVVVLAIYLALAVQGLQVLLFFSIGRLPALAYSDSISVRFGSFLDDPNGFGLLACWMVVFAWAYFERAKRALILFLLALSVLLTQSLTALACFAVVCLLYPLLGFRWSLRSGAVAMAAVAGVVTVVGLAVYPFRRPLSEALRLFMLSKQGSIAGHAESLSLLERVGSLSLSGIEPMDEAWGESGYVNLLMYFGVLYVLVFLLFGAVALWRYLHLFSGRSTRRETRAFSAGAFGFLATVYVANLNLPVTEMFPLNLFTAVLLGLATAELQVPPEGTGVTPGAHEKTVGAQANS